MIIIFVSFILLGVMMMLFFADFWRTEKETTLEKNAHSVATIAATTISGQQDASLEVIGIETSLLDIIISNTASNIDADIFVTDTNGKVLRGFFYNSGKEDGVAVSRDIVDRALAGKYVEQSNVGGFYDTDRFAVGVPIILNVDGEEKVIGAVFAATENSSMGAYQSKTLEIFIVAALMVLAIAFLITSFFSYSFVLPLREMNRILKIFGEGDLSVRMKVESNDELGTLAASFNETAATLSNGENIRRSFIANISHELKTPMTTIAGFVDGILDGTIPPEMEKKYLELVSDEVRRLSRLVKSMLDLSRIDGGELRLSMSSFDITETVINTLDAFSLAIEEKEIEIRGIDKAKREMVYADKDLIHQVIYNLMENAVKFTNKGGYISATVTSGIDRVSVAIENSGDGIDSDDIPLLFDRFYKTDKSRSKDKKGLGLGLYLVRTIVRLHGGEISVSSVAGEYARFEFYLPAEIHFANTLISEVFDAEIIDIEPDEKDKEKPDEQSK